MSSLGARSPTRHDEPFCSTCAFSMNCLAAGVDPIALDDLEMLIEHNGPLAAGSHIFREGDRFGAIAAVRSGTVKTYSIDRDGRERVLGFHLPGEIIGFSGIDGDLYPCSAVALDDVELCRFAFPRISQLATRMPSLQHQLFRLLSRDIGRAHALAGDWSAEQRLAAFFIGLSRKLERRGKPHAHIELSMSRTDIANYLRLTPETVSRMLRRFQTDGLIRIHRRDLRLLNRARLAAIAEPLTLLND